MPTDNSRDQAQFNVPVDRRDAPTPMSRSSSGAMQITVSNAEEAQRLARYAQAQRPSDPNHGWRPKATIAGKQEVIIQGGKITSATSQDKTQGAVTHYAVQPTRPGYIAIPGFGETTVEAAKAGGLLPQNWQEGDANPFSEPAKAPGRDHKAEAGDEKQDAGELTVAQHQAKVAGEILDKADQIIGSEATDAMLDDAVTSGELPEDGLPPGITPLMVKQVHAGYVAQANATLGTVGASVDMLSEMLTDAELLQARRATIAGEIGKADLAALGQQAVSRLAQLPQTDPEGFLQMVADMAPAERKCIRFDNQRGEWIVKLPGKGEMSYGAAVHAGFVRL